MHFVQYPAADSPSEPQAGHFTISAMATQSYHPATISGSPITPRWPFQRKPEVRPTLPCHRPGTHQPLPRFLKRPDQQPIKYTRYATGEMTVGIAARILRDVPALVLCSDLKGSVEWSSSETTHKMIPLRFGFTAQIAGHESNAKELARHCHEALGATAPSKNGGRQQGAPQGTRRA